MTYLSEEALSSILELDPTRPSDRYRRAELLRKWYQEANAGELGVTENQRRRIEDALMEQN